MPANSDQCDLLIMFATTTEKEQLRDVANSMGIAFVENRDRDLGRYYVLGNLGSYRVNAIRSELGTFGYNGAASKTMRSISRFKATSIVQYGMAFGTIPRIQGLGDVLVSSSLFTYDNRRVYTPGNPKKPGNRRYRTDYSANIGYPASLSLLNLFGSASGIASEDYRVFTGIMLSGGAKIQSARYRNELVRAVPGGDSRVVGGEMEACGLLSVCEPKRPIWIVVKGISDFADENRNRVIEKSRILACRNAAEFILSALRHSSDNYRI